MNATNLLLFACICLQKITAVKSQTKTYMSNFYQSSMTGNEINFENGNSLFHCILSCELSNFNCSGVQFCNDAIETERCQNICCGRNQISQALMSGCQLYMQSFNFITPRLYFPLDGIGLATPLGEQSNNVQFVNGKVCNAFYNPLHGAVPKSYLNLGHYPDTEFCCGNPEQCELGVTYSFWLNILGSTGQWQGIITTMPANGPGFYACWYEGAGGGLYFNIRRDADTAEEWIKIRPLKFYNQIGYGTWKHYVVTYLFEETNPSGNNMDVYVDGVIRPDSEKFNTSDWGDYDNTDGYHGNLELGQYFLGYNTGYGYLMMDQLMIWEERLTYDEILQLMDT